MDNGNLATVEKMWRREVEAAHTYKLLADRETDPKRRSILLRLAEQEDKHAARWSERIPTATGRAPDPKEVERGSDVVPAHRRLRASCCIASSRRRPRPKPSTTT